MKNWFTSYERLLWYLWYIITTGAVDILDYLIYDAKVNPFTNTERDSNKGIFEFICSNKENADPSDRMFLNVFESERFQEFVINEYQKHMKEYEEWLGFSDEFNCVL